MPSHMHACGPGIDVKRLGLEGGQSHIWPETTQTALFMAFNATLQQKKSGGEALFRGLDPLVNTGDPPPPLHHV